jgi:hypothetical protein
MENKLYKKYLKYKNKYFELKGGAAIRPITGYVENQEIKDKSTDAIIGRYTGMMQEGDRDTYDYDEDTFPDEEGIMVYNNNNKYTGDWKHDKRQGRGIYNDYSQATVDTEYNGMWYNDNRDGKGEEYIYHKGTDIIHSIYTGTWFNDMKDGRGKLTIYNYSDSTMDTCISETQIISVWNKGIMKEHARLTKYDSKTGNKIYVYDGMFKNDRMDGNGTLTLYDPETGIRTSVYEGQFKNDRMDGNGTLTLYDPEIGIRTSVYEGQFKNDRMDGNGTLTLYDPEIGIRTSVYEGQFKASKKEGKGIMTTFDDDKLYENFDGTWVNDIKQGHFILKEYNENEEEIYTYIGEFSHDIMNGYGVAINKRQHTKYAGMFKDNMFHGKGILTFFNHPTFKEYSGDFFEGRRQGNGTMIYNNMKYIGTWDHDMRHGKGEIINSEGRGEGEYEEDIIVEGTFNMNDGRIITFARGREPVVLLAKR